LIIRYFRPDMVILVAVLGDFALCDIANYGTNFDLNGVTLFRVYG
jgi:hypothetical protein